MNYTPINGGSIIDPRTHSFELSPIHDGCAVCGCASDTHNQKINIDLLKESLTSGGWTSSAVAYIINAVMKAEGPAKILIVLFMLLIAAAPAHAVWEFPQNPDRFPSFGFNYSNASLQGDRHEMDTPNPLVSRDNVGDRSEHNQNFGGDFRLPFSDSGTFTFGVDSVSTWTNFVRSDAVYHEKDKLTGWKYSIGLRVYINR